MADPQATDAPATPAAAPDRRRLLDAVVLGVLGAVPTLLLALTRPTLMADDWGFADLAATEGLGGFLDGSDVRSRPLQAAYHGVTFVVLGDAPVPHLLLLAALNGVAVALLYLALANVCRRHAAVLGAAVWAVIGTRGAVRFWIATGPIALSLVLLGGAAVAATAKRPRPVLCTGLVVASCLAYEGGIAVGALLVVVAAWRAAPPPRRYALAGASVAVVAAVAAWTWATSPKRGAPAEATITIDRIQITNLGPGVLPPALEGLADLLPLVVLLAVVAAAVPASRRIDSARLLAVGAVVAVAGLAPFVATSFPLSTVGMLTRANAFASVGVALLLAGALENLWRLPSRLAAPVAAVVVAVLGTAQLRDVDHVQQVARDADRFLDAVVDVEDPPEGTWVLAPMPNRGGYAAFGYDTVGGAVHVRTGRRLAITDALTESELEDHGGPVLRFDGEELRADG